MNFGAPLTGPERNLLFGRHAVRTEERQDSLI